MIALYGKYLSGDTVTDSRKTMGTLNVYKHMRYKHLEPPTIAKSESGKTTESNHLLTNSSLVPIKQPCGITWRMYDAYQEAITYKFTLMEYPPGTAQAAFWYLFQS